MPSDTRRAVIMAGGIGSRMAPYTSVLPKPLMPVDGQPVLEVTLRQLKRHGFGHVTLCVGYLGQLITAYFGNGSKLGLSIEYAVETEPLGTIGPLRLVDDFDEPLLVMNGDVLTALDFADLYDTHLRTRPILTVATCLQRQEVPFGVVTFDQSNRITGFREKPDIDLWVCMGTYVADPAIRDYLPPEGPFGFDALVEAVQAAGQTPMAYPYDGLWHDLGKREDCLRAAETFRQHRDVLLP